MATRATGQVVRGRGRGHAGDRQVRILRQIEVGRPVVEATPHKVLDGVEPDRPQAHGVLDGAADVGEPKVLEEPQHLHVLARARLAQPRL